MIIYNLTEKMLYDLLMDTIEEGHNSEMEQRERYIIWCSELLEPLRKILNSHRRLGEVITFQKQT